MLIPFNGNMYDVGLYLTLLDQEALEHLVHIDGVTGSNPVSTTKIPPVRAVFLHISQKVVGVNNWLGKAICVIMRQKRHISLLEKPTDHIENKVLFERLPGHENVRAAPDL